MHIATMQKNHTQTIPRTRFMRKSDMGLVRMRFRTTVHSMFSSCSMCYFKKDLAWNPVFDKRKLCIVMRKISTKRKSETFIRDLIKKLSFELPMDNYKTVDQIFFFCTFMHQNAALETTKIASSRKVFPWNKRHIGIIMRYDAIGSCPVECVRPNLALHC